MGRVAVVTGSNKGIGYAIVRGLCLRLEQRVVYLTSRDVDLGQTAVTTLKKELPPAAAAKLRYHQLDICDRNSIESIRDHLKKDHSGLDILINNAGIAFKVDSSAAFSEQAEVTVNTNYFGTRHVCEILAPILNSHSRVVFVCSRSSSVNNNYCESLKSESLTVDDLDAIANDFIAYECAKEGSHQKKGYPNTAYGMSTAMKIALSFAYHRSLTADASRPGIVVNACCPGYVATDMSSYKGTLTPDQGAETPLWLALLPTDDRSVPRGRFCYDLQAHGWPAESM